MQKTSKFLIVGAALAGAVLTFSLVGALETSAASASCTPNASKQCISNIVYWYNSCGVLETVAQNCNKTNQICQNATCVDKPTTGGNGGGNTAQHVAKSCYNGNLYWFNSQGMVNDLYKTCNDNNSCTQDNCGGNQCVNQLKCDGSTCATGSADYTKYCATGGQNNQNNQGNQNPTPTTTASQGLVISAFVAKDSNNPQWTKTLTATSNDKLDFLFVIKNTSATPTDAVSVKADISNNINYTGSLKVNNLDAAGNLTTGVELGSIAAKTSMLMSFTGTMQPQANQSVVQATATVSANNAVADSDYVIVNTNATTQNIATTGATNSLWSNLQKNWYIWLIIIVVLIVVFIIIFRRLSTNV